MKTHPNCPPGRRRFLTTVGAAAFVGTAGCLDRFPSLGDPDPPPFGPIEAGWPMLARDPANTSRNPAADGPTTEPEVIWEFNEGSKFPQTVVEDDIFIVDTEEELFGFNLATNELAWRRDVSSQFSAPALEDRKLFTKTGETELRCIDAYTGETIWEAQTGSRPRINVAANTVVVLDDKGVVYAFDAESGTKLWELQEDGRRNILPTAIFEDILYLESSSELAAVDLHTGEDRWRSEEIFGMPTIAERTLFASRPEITALTLDGEIRWKAVTRGTPPTIVNGRGCSTRSGPQKQIVLSTETGEVLWEQRNRHWGGKPITDGKLAYIGSEQPAVQLYCVDPVNETEVFRKRFDETMQALMVVDDMVFVGTPSGTLLALR